MTTFLQWINEPGAVRVVVDVLLLPLLSVALIFGLRAALLRLIARGDPSDLVRSVSGFVAVILSLGAVSVIWHVRLAGLAARAGATAEEANVLSDWLVGIADVVLATVVLVLALVLLSRAFRYLVTRIDGWARDSDGVRVQRLVLIPPTRLRQMATLSLRVLRFALVLTLFYFFVPLVLHFIPATRPVADQVMPMVIAPARQIGLAILGYLPRLVSLVVIVFIVRYVLRLLGFLFAALGKEEISLPGFDPEWAEQTFRLVRVVIILATAMVMYPFLPGAGSEVFKGFSVFVGALFTLGASGSVANVISGVVLTYTRSFRVGDRARVGGAYGDIVSKGLFVTRIRTPLNEVVTVPNTVAMGGQVVNYSRAEPESGLVLTVTAGIGYDVDWRVVHKLLKQAALDTEGVLGEPAPVVFQTSLSDFAVEYTLRAHTADPGRAPRICSDLRQNALDVFNQAGVEIMTPDVMAVRNSVEPTLPEEFVRTPGPSALRFLGMQPS